MSEIFEIVDSNNQVLGTAFRSECHGNPALLHRAVHVVVFDGRGRILLQKRSANKDIQPGKWDSAVGGHLGVGETFEAAARREMGEELGIPADYPLRYLFDMEIRNAIESENIQVFAAIKDGGFRPCPVEVDEIKFWTRPELEATLGSGIFTPNCEVELRRLFDLRQDQDCSKQPSLVMT